ncbi:hypothetical protein R5R35_013129 [Gryllus longicercus]|uniref:Uncharacterized protein n=1 Tax=Gryllus longicercus TaxID=2509291 RepID=A0AAN9ZK77_9ORTH
MQSPKDSSPAVAAAQVPTQPGVADEAQAASQPRSPARDARPPSSPSSVAPSSSASTSSSTMFLLSEDGLPSAQTAANGCVFAHRVRSLPAVQALLGAYASAKTYPVVGWALSVGEESALLAAVVCRPVAVVCRAPLFCADWCLCKALDVAEAVFPCVSMRPSQVYYGAQERVKSCVCWLPRATARSLAMVCGGSRN